MDTSLIVFQFACASFCALLFFTVDWWWVHGARLMESRVPALPVSQRRFSPWEPAPGTVLAPSCRWSGSGLGRGAAGPRARAQACSREGFSEEQLKCIPVYLMSLLGVTFKGNKREKAESGAGWSIFEAGALPAASDQLSHFEDQDPRQCAISATLIAWFCPPIASLWVSSH